MASNGQPPLPQTDRPSSGGNKKGIPIEDALSILSGRSRDGSEAVTTDASGSKGTSSSSQKTVVSDDMKKMGQTIDLVDQMEFAKMGKNGSMCDCSEAAAAAGVEDAAAREALEKDETHAAMQAERSRRSAAIREELDGMGVSDLFGAIFVAQRERVSTYREYDRALGAVLASGNITDYPAACAHATASFSVLSDTVNVVRSVLSTKHRRKDSVEIMDRLQKHEGEKLNLTAALHLERIRANDTDLGGGGGETETRLFREGVRSLEVKVAKSMEEINEILEELRYAAAEEDE